MGHGKSGPDGARSGHNAADAAFVSPCSAIPSKGTYIYIHRHPGRPLTPFKPENTAAIKKPEKRGPTEVKT